MKSNNDSYSAKVLRQIASETKPMYLARYYDGQSYVYELRPNLDSTGKPVPGFGLYPKPQMWRWVSGITGDRGGSAISSNAGTALSKAMRGKK